jgi:hypothetical protein
MQALVLPPAVLVGHSIGCRVVVEAGDDPRGRRCRVDGSQFAPAMEATLRETL